MGAIRAHLDYIRRHGQVELEDQDGNTIFGRPEVRDLAQMWRVAGRGIAEMSSKREAFNVMLSMPPGTDRAAVKDAARAFAREEFGEQRDYVFAAHDDEAHPHVHIVVLTCGRDGKRLNPRKADLQRWRERFAQELRDHGVEANATPRRTRGVAQQYQTQASRHMGARNAEIHKRTNMLLNPQQVFNASLPTLSAWRRVASVLAESSRAGDPVMAKDIASFVRQMPVVTAVRGSNEVDGQQPGSLLKFARSETQPSEKIAPDIEP
jgi:hypothetical protein